MKQEIIIDGIVYVPKQDTPETNGMKYVIVRTYSAGCFAGYLRRRENKEVELWEARRLWYWDGAASLSELAMSGTSKPENCKFPESINKIVLTESIEIIDCTVTAMQSIKAVKIWKA